jgi:cysteinyl-tRNA synthetase
MKIYNSLSRKIENFQSLFDDVVKMYVCGPTVYDRIHIGNARSIIVFDFIYAKLGYLQSLLHKNSSKSGIIVQIETMVFKNQLYGRR